MSFITKLLGGDLLKGVGDILDKFITTPEEKAKIQLEIQEKLLQIQESIEDSYQAELTARTEIIKAEMATGDNYTKRARPTIVYAGIGFILLVYVIFPILAFISGTPANALPQLELPTEFWWSWGTVVSVYGVGRSAEKMGIQNTLTGMITGSKKPK